jgi:hypothetical protein
MKHPEHLKENSTPVPVAAKYALLILHYLALLQHTHIILH